VLERRPERFKEKVARKVRAQLEKMAVDQRGCWFSLIYEPDIPDELIDEMANWE